MLTESPLAVAELQPLYGSADAVGAHDSPGNKQKHNRFKDISTPCRSQSHSLHPSVSLFSQCCAAQNNQIITGFCYCLPPLPPNSTPSNIWPIKSAASLTAQRLNHVVTWMFGKFQRTHKNKVNKPTWQSNYNILDSPPHLAVSMCVFVCGEVQIKNWRRWLNMILLSGKAELSVRANETEWAASDAQVWVCVCVCQRVCVKTAHCAHADKTSQDWAMIL